MAYLFFPMFMTEEPLKTHAAAVYPYSEELAKKFSRVSNFDDPYELFRQVNYQGYSHIWLPRSLCPLGEQDLRVSGTPVEFQSVFEPRNAEQARVIEESTALLLGGQSHIVEAPTGFGKTWLTGQIIANVGKKTLVVTTKEDVKIQWVNAIKALLGLSDSEIGYIQGNKCSVEGKKIVIALIQSTHKLGRYPQNTYSDFGLMIVDEVHRMGADKFSQTAWQVPARLRLGLSATPYRRDGKDVVFRGHIGPVSVRTKHQMLVPKVLMVPSGWEVPMVNRYHNGVLKAERVPHTPGRIAGLVNYMVKDPHRNKVLCGCIAAAYEKGRNIVVMTDSRKHHIPLLFDLLPSFGVSIQDIGFYVGGMTEEEREKAKAKKVVLATYKMTSEATDVPWWDTCVLATPKSDVVQIVGRVLREWEGKPKPVVFDFNDRGSYVLDAFREKRIRWYQSIKAEVRKASIAA